MEIRSGVEGLKSLLGVNEPASGTAGAKGRAFPARLGSDCATLSSAANEVSIAAREDSVRSDKVAQIQAAIAAGLFNVPASAVAPKVVDAMLNGQK